MTLRFFRRIKLAPGLSLNLSKHGGSLSVGPPGMKYTVGTSGTRRTVGLPGTGLYYTEHGSHSSGQNRRGRSRAAAQDPADRLDLGFFKRLFTPDAEKHFVDGMRHVVAADSDDTAIAALNSPNAVGDALFMAGMLALRAERYREALSFFDRAQAKEGELGDYFYKYGVAAQIRLPITERISAIIEPSLRGITLARAEAEQAREHWQSALAALEALHTAAPDDAVVILSLAEILVEEQADDAAWRRVVELTHNIDNHSQLEAAILYWKGRALRRLNLLTAARDALTAAFRRKKDRDPELLAAIQYERALVYDALGQHSRAREEFGRIYADNPNYEDVAERIC
jgi:tetratricopeptide (TPR) repeat protein